MKLDREIWKPVIGYEDWYQISNLGRIKRIKATVGAVVGRILKPSTSHNGYFEVVLSRKNATRHFRVSRLVAMAFLSNPKNKPEVNHKNGIKTDNWVGNLEWATHSENLKHDFRVLGTRNHQEFAKLIQINFGHIFKKEIILKLSGRKVLIEAEWKEISEWSNKYKLILKSRTLAMIWFEGELDNSKKPWMAELAETATPFEDFPDLPSAVEWAERQLGVKT